MKKYNKKDFELLSIQIGCLLRYSRLKKGWSQHELGLLLETNSTMVGRIERFENIPGWDKILAMSQALDIEFCWLFELKEKKYLLSIVEESFKLEDKLTQDKRDYYRFLRKIIEDSYS